MARAMVLTFRDCRTVLKSAKDAMNDVTSRPGRNQMGTATARGADDRPYPAGGGPGPRLLDILDHALSHLAEAWPDGYAPIRSIAALHERLQDTRFHLAVLGQFKRGKSTFINALLRAHVLPTGAVPLTAIPTFIAWGPARRISVTYRDERASDEFQLEDSHGVRDRLVEFATEEGNPANRRGVARVDVCLPADILRDGVVLIDTPGIGSTLLHNTDAALHVLPECDAALFIISADPPITEAEITYLALVRAQVVRMFFVLNKVDYLSASERSQVEDFVRRVLRNAAGAVTEVEVYATSAKQALDAALSGDADAFAASGLDRVEQQVVQYLSREKSASLALSVRSKAAKLIEQATGDLSLQVRALEMPIEDLECRSIAFRDALRGIEGERRAAQDMLAGDRRRASEALEIEADALRQACREHLTEVAEQAIRAHDGGVDDSVHQAVGRAVPGFFEHRLGATTTRVRQTVEQILSNHQARADALVESVRRTAANLFDIPFRAAEPPEPFRLGPDPYWVTRPSDETLIPSPETLLLRLLPPAARQGRLRRRLEEQIATLAQRNVENLRWAILRGLNETFRRFGAQQDLCLSDALVVTEEAISSALERRRARADEAAAELARLRGIAERLEALRAELGESSG
jgi:GTP-binding protein EngB required for normal cell division